MKYVITYRPFSYSGRRGRRLVMSNGKIYKTTKKLTALNKAKTYDGRPRVVRVKWL